MGRAHEHGIDLSLAIDIRGVAPVTGDEADVFAAFYRLSNSGFAHALLLFRRLKTIGRHGLRACRNRPDNVVVAGAAAEIPIQFFADRRLVEAVAFAAD